MKTVPLGAVAQGLYSFLNDGMNGRAVLEHERHRRQGWSGADCLLVLRSTTDGKAFDEGALYPLGRSVDGDVQVVGSALYPDIELEAGRELEKRGAVGKRARQRPDAAKDKRSEERESE